MFARPRLFAGALLAAGLALVPGCAEPEPVLTPVSGVIQDADGKPLNDIRVEFHPDPTRKTVGTYSSGQTNAAGEFGLRYEKENKSPTDGAVAGFHKVVLIDLNRKTVEQGADPVPGRVADRYSNAGTTPLTAEVKPGAPPLVIKLEPEPKEEPKAKEEPKDAPKEAPKN